MKTFQGGLCRTGFVFLAALACGTWLLLLATGSVGWSQTNTAVIDQSQLASGGREWIRLGRELAQSFRAGLDGRLVGVDLDVWFPDPSVVYALRLSIVETVDGAPTGAVLGRTVVAPYAQWGWGTIPLDFYPVYLRSNSVYAMVLSSDAPANSAGVSLTGVVDSYPRGTEWEKYSTNEWHTIPGDLLFQTWMIPGWPPVWLSGPLRGAAFREGAAIELRAELAAPDATAVVEFYSNGQWLGSDGTAPYEWTWPNVPVGLQALYAVVEAEGGLRSTSVVTQITVRPPGPANDDFADRLLLEGGYTRGTGSNLAATAELGEPVHLTNGLGASVWWSWTAPVSGPAYLSVANSGATNLSVAAYYGTTVDSLRALGQGRPDLFFEAVAGRSYELAVDSLGETVSGIVLDVAASDVRLSSPTEQQWFVAPAAVPMVAVGEFTNREQARVEFYVDGTRVGTRTEAPWAYTPVVEGPGYHVVQAETVDGRQVRTRSPSVPIRARPSNDDFVAAVPLSGFYTNVRATTLAATMEAGEPDWADNQGGHSIWYTWTVPESGSCTISGTGLGWGLLLTVLLGSYSSYSIVAHNASAGPGSWVLFQALAGVTYRIAVDGYWGEEGPVEFTVQLSPGHDPWLGAALARGDQFVATSSNRGATRETGEPAHGGRNEGRSVWWQWRAPASGWTTFSCRSVDLNPILGVYTGSSLTQLVLVASAVSTDGESAALRFHAEQGTTYSLVVDGENLSGTEFEVGLIMALLRVVSPVSGSVATEPASVPIEVEVPTEQPAVGELELLANDRAIGTTGPSPAVFLWPNVPAGSHSLRARGVDEQGATNTSLPVTILVYTNHELPTPQIAAGYAESYAINAVGQMYVWGVFLIGDFGLTADTNAVFIGGDPEDPFSWVIPDAVKSLFPEPAPYPEGVSQWKAVTGGTWAIGNNGQLYRGGIELIPMPAGVTRWVWLDGGLTLGDDGHYYFQGRLGLPQPEMEWAKIRGAMHLTRDGRLFVRGAQSFSLVPFPEGVQAWSECSTRGLHFMALATNGQLYTWGFNHSGQLGLGDNRDRATPTLVPLPAGVASWKAIAAGEHFSLALADNGQLYACGRNWESQLGIGAAGALTVNRPTEVVRPPGVSAWTAIAVGLTHSLAIGNDCQLYTWGFAGDGALGIGFQPSQPVPVPVPGLGSLCGIPIVLPDARSQRLEDGTYRIEFDTAMNRLYTIQYSADAQNWKTVQPPLLGTGARMVWMDSGPPQTESVPGSEKARFYRVLHGQ